MPDPQRVKALTHWGSGTLAFLGTMNLCNDGLHHTNKEEKRVSWSDNRKNQIGACHNDNYPIFTVLYHEKSLFKMPNRIDQKN